MADKEPVQLRTFIEDNHRLLSVIGVFTGLSVFSINAGHGKSAAVLACFLLTASMLLWHEFLRGFPKAAEWRLSLFKWVINGAWAMLTTYTVFVAYRALGWYLTFIVWLWVLGLSNYVYTLAIVKRLVARQSWSKHRALRLIAENGLLLLGAAMCVLVSRLIIAGVAWVGPSLEQGWMGADSLLTKH